VLPHRGGNPGGKAGLPTASAPPPAPVDRPHRGNMVDRDRDHDRDGGPGRPDRFESGRIDTARADRDGFSRQRGQVQPQPVTVQQQAPGTVPNAVPVRPQSIVSPTPRMSNAPQPVVSPTPHMAPTPQPLTTDQPVYPSATALPGAQPQPRQDRRDWDEVRRERRDDDRRERRENEDRRERRFAPTPAPAPVSMAAPSAPVQQAAPRPAPEARFERREAPQRVAPPAPAPAPAPSRPAPARGEEHKRGDDRRQNER
jgi:hypothetical protein